MHSFNSLIVGGTNFTLSALNKASDEAVAVLDQTGSTPPILALKSVNWQKVVLATGALAIFEARLQAGLSSPDGFQAADEILEQEDQNDLKIRFVDLRLAINALKHGKGRSYDSLVAKANSLPFRVKLPMEDFFYEGDVAEIDTLIEVNDEFVRQCVSVISEVAEVLQNVHPDCYI